MKQRYSPNGTGYVIMPYLSGGDGAGVIVWRHVLDDVMSDLFRPIGVWWCVDCCILPWPAAMAIYAAPLVLVREETTPAAGHPSKKEGN